MERYLTATECHLPYGITQCYLPLYTSEHTRLNPSQRGWYSIFLPRMDGTYLVILFLLLLFLLLLPFLLVVTVFKKAQGSVVSNGIRMKFGRSVLQVNTHRLRESDRDLTSHFQERPWRYFMQKSAATWRVHTKRLPGTYAAASASSWSIVHSYLSVIGQC